MFEQIRQVVPAAPRARGCRLPLLQRRRRERPVWRASPHRVAPDSQRALRRAGREPQVEIFGTDYPRPTARAYATHIHIADLSQAHILALAPGKTGFYNLGNGEGFSVKQVVATCEQGHAA
jgi:nucleoside-diphosphate-sugar epimerase